MEIAKIQLTFEANGKTVNVSGYDLLGLRKVAERELRATEVNFLEMKIEKL